MVFKGIIKGLLKGKRFTREGWDDKRTHVAISDHLLCIRKAGEKDYRPWILSDADLLSDDWKRV